MKKSVLIGIGVAGVLSLGVGAFVVFGLMGSEEVAPLPIEVVAPEREPILVLERPENTPLEIFGPECYEDGRGNDALVATLPQAQTDCFAFRNGGNDLVDLSDRAADSPVLIAINGSQNSRQTIRLGGADDYIELQGEYNATIEGVNGQNSVLALPQITTIDLRFRQQGANVILSTPRGEVTLVRQAIGSGLEGPISHLILRDGKILGRSQIRVQSVVGQGTPQNDLIRSTNNDDIIYPGLGNDTITLLGGQNSVFFEGGMDSITSSGEGEAFNTLYIERPREEVAIDVTNQNRDIVLSMPEGSVTLRLQAFYPLGDPRVPVQRIVFMNGPISDEELRFLIEIEDENINNGVVDDRIRLRQ